MDAQPNSNRGSKSSLPETEREPLPTDSMVTVPLSDLQFSPREPEPANRQSIISVSRPENGEDDNNVVVEESTETEGDISTVPEAGESLADADPFSPTDEVNDARSTRSEGEEGEERVDWEVLEKTEELEPKTDATDESTALLLARLEQENNALAVDPKSGLSNGSRSKRTSRPPSIQHIKKLVDEPESSVRYSQLPTPRMTELEFWAALVADYPRTAQKLPTVTSNKIRAGVPPPLRSVVWPSIAGATDSSLRAEFERLCGESSPYEGIIGKDIGRSFPEEAMFRDPNGDGQQMLARVLKCFSLYDSSIGYCQGLGFVVGPLLMNMTDVDAFCVLVRLMDHYDLRSCFQPSLSGLHLRIYQFQTILSRHLPDLHKHLEELHIEPIYVSQWFLSFFAVTCPLPMLLRVYDVLLLEGACETLMRVALSLMQRNEKKLLSYHEYGDVMQLLLSKSLWDTYGDNPDELVQDFVSLTSLVTRESLQALEASFQQSKGIPQSASFFDPQGPLSKFLGRFWAGSNNHNSVKSLAPAPTPASRPASVVRRTPSKQSMASTLNSFESTSDASTAPTEASSSANSTKEPSKNKGKQAGIQNKDKDLHTQIEDLLMALTDMQREQATLAKELQREREEREEDQQIAKLMLGYIKEPCDDDEQKSELIAKADERFSTSAESRRVSVLQTKQQLREDVAMWKEKHELESARCQDLTRRLDEHEHENAQMREQLREARSRLQDSHKEKQRLERTVQELRTRKGNTPESPTDASSSPTKESHRMSVGLREFKLGKTPPAKTSTFSKRTSSLGAQAFMSGGENSQAAPAAAAAPEEGLLLELVNAKTAEAVARQELEEVKAKLESLRRLMSRPGNNNSSPLRSSPLSSSDVDIVLTSPAPLSKTQTEPVKPSSPAPSSSTGGGGGFFSGWVKRSPSSATTRPSADAT